MSKWEKAFVIFYLVETACYAPFFLTGYPSMEVLDPWHTFGMLMGIPLLIIPFHDLYKRSFPNPNSKVTWAILMLYTGGIGLFVYIFKHGFKPREPLAPHADAGRSGGKAPISNLEKGIVAFGLLYMVCYIPFFLYVVFKGGGPRPEAMVCIILPLHALGMVLSLVLLFIAFRDLYRRGFANPNDKVTWTIVILATCGIGLFAYLFMHDFKPRAAEDSAGEAGKEELRGDRPCP